MTPLAHRIMKDWLLPPRKRRFVDQCGLMDRMDDIHCFEVTAVLETFLDLGRQLLSKDATAGELGFLPAPNTWIEFVEPSGQHRCGFLLQEAMGGKCAVVRTAVAKADGSFGSLSYVGGLDLACAKLTEGRVPVSMTGVPDPEGEVVFASFLYAALAYINTPKVIGRRVHAPHRGLEKALLSRQQAVGRFPLHAWTEIVLEVTPPADESGEPPLEARLTGKRALHFVRAHLRIWNGQLIHVSAHWRGNEALGIKRSRYVVKPPRPGKPVMVDV